MFTTFEYLSANKKFALINLDIIWGINIFSIKILPFTLSLGSLLQTCCKNSIRIPSRYKSNAVVPTQILINKWNLLQFYRNFLVTFFGIELGVDGDYDWLVQFWSFPQKSIPNIFMYKIYRSWFSLQNRIEVE